MLYEKIFERLTKKPITETKLERKANVTVEEMDEIHMDICGLVLDSGKLFDATEQLANRLDELKQIVENQQTQIDRLEKLIRRGR